MHRTHFAFKSLHTSASSMHRSQSTPPRCLSSTPCFLGPLLCIEPDNVVQVDPHDTFLTLLCIELNPHLPECPSSTPCFLGTLLCIEPGQMVEVYPRDTLVTLLCIELTWNSSPYTLVSVLCIELNPHLPECIPKFNPLPFGNTSMHRTHLEFESLHTSASSMHRTQSTPARCPSSTPCFWEHFYA
jgi:hypothetical protein